MAECSTAITNERVALTLRRTTNCKSKRHCVTGPRRTSVYQTKDMRLESDTSEEGPGERAGSGDLEFQTTARGGGGGYGQRGK
jgi:hypothetical protein